MSEELKPGRFILPIDGDVRDMIEKYEQELQHLAVPAEMLVEDAFRYFMSDAPSSYSHLMEYICDAYSCIAETEMEDCNSPELQCDLDRCLGTAQESTMFIAEKLQNAFNLIAPYVEEHRVWDVFRIGKDICIGVGPDVGKTKYEQGYPAHGGVSPIDPRNQSGFVI